MIKPTRRVGPRSSPAGPELAELDIPLEEPPRTELHDPAGVAAFMLVSRALASAGITSVKVV